MKTKYALILITVALLSIEMKAQTETTVTTTSYPEGLPKEELRRFYMGLRFMPTFSDFEVRTIEDGTAETEFVLGYGFGGYLGFNFSRNVGLQLEVIYSTLSQKYTYKNIDRQLDLSYVHFPLLLALNTDVTQYVNFNVTVGPQLGLNAGTETNNGGFNAGDTVIAVVAVKPADVGFAYGAGLDFKVTEGFKIELGFRGVYGLVDISENNKNLATNEYYVLDRSHVKTYAGYVGLRLEF